MQILTRTVAALALTVVAAGAARAQAKAPDFSGTWELNVAKSDFGQMPAPTKGTLTVAQSGATLKITQTMSAPQGDVSQSQDFTLDGKDVTTNAADGQPVTRSAKVDGDALVIGAKLQRQGMDITQASRWTMSPDGKMLTIDQQVATSMGAMTSKVVFDKK